MVKQYRHLRKIFPECIHLIHTYTGQEVEDLLPEDFEPENLLDFLAGKLNEYSLPAYLHDLAAIEFRLYQTAIHKHTFDQQPKELIVNPTLSLLQVEWLDLPTFLLEQESKKPPPDPGADYVLFWKDPLTAKPVVRSAKPNELLALKIVVEKLDKRELAQAEKTSLAYLDQIIDLAVHAGILLKPDSNISRSKPHRTEKWQINEKYLTAQVFTLQCHITQDCDLHCRHCYDRSNRAALTLDNAVRVLDQLYDFCQTSHIYGQVSFTGGNPLLHPQFFDIYREAADRGFMTAILGNPTTPEILSQINEIQKPEFYQVSLEGLQKHNDYIRGTGFFDRVMQFLEHLRAADIFSMVMLTLTKENMDQVIPLADLLKDKADLFTFNRLSMVGEGALLQTPDIEEYQRFLLRYLTAKKNNPIMGLKDNLINIITEKQGKNLFGGCAGHGCGAAFNFVALLPDGEVHACRKFNSPIGNIHEQSLAEIYNSSRAALYRKGPSKCEDCRLRAVCGGCLAVIDSRGMDITIDRDPCCFID